MKFYENFCALVAIIVASLTVLPTFVLFPTYAQVNDAIESEIEGISPKQDPNAPFEESGIYTKNRIPTQMLALGKEVLVVFAINENMIKDNTKVHVTYQVTKNQEDPFDLKNYKEYRLDSLNPKEISLPFIPKEIGTFFLQEDLSYYIDDKNSYSSSGLSMPFVVVEKFSNAVGEDGHCKNSNRIIIHKPDFSKNICVKPTTLYKLMCRWDYYCNQELISAIDKFYKNSTAQTFPNTTK